MRVLGIGGAFGHDAAAALVVDGEILAACEEERFTRHKRAVCQPPEQSLQACLHAGGLELADIDCIALGWDPALAPEDQRLSASVDGLLASNRLANERDLPPIVPVEHHVAHAALAYYTSGYNQAAILVVDGQGEAVSTTLYAGKDDDITELRRFPVEASLGFLFAAVTRYIGFSPGSAGKTMGLAALGRPTYGFPEIELNRDGYAVQMPGESKPERMTGWLERLNAVFGSPGQRAFGIDERTGLLRGDPELAPHLRDAAASTQAVLERVVVHLADIALRLTGAPNLVLGGGVALNCAANGRLRAAFPQAGLAVHGAAHDGGTALGAALAVAARHGDGRSSPHPRRSLFLGPPLRAAAAIDHARRLGLTVDEPSAGVGEHVAERLERGQVGGWCRNRMEYGPRALGARSIVARADDRDIADRVNRIKGREGWRPLGPALMPSLAHALGIAPHGLDSMIEARWPTCAGELSGVVHKDGSIRPQVVEGREHPFSDLLAGLEARTGARAVINTSCNLEHEPIVQSAMDALRTFVSSDLDFLVLDDVLIAKIRP